MRLYLSTILIAIIANCTIVSAQWTSHISLKSCTLSAISTEGEIVGNSVGLMVHYSDGSVVKLCKSNHLSDTEISAVTANKNIAYIGYSNGNIDIVNLTDLTTTNIPELKNYSAIEDKTINSITYYDQKLYCATNCGIIVVNLNKNEISSRYLIRTQSQITINKIVISNDTIFAATQNGLYYANIKSYLLENTEEWQQYGNINANVSDIVAFDNQVIIAKGSKGSTNQIYKCFDNKCTELWQIAQFRNFSTNASELLITSNNKLYVYDKNLNATNSINSVTTIDETIAINAYNATLSDKGIIVIADASEGMIIINDESNANKYCLNGPYNNNSFALHALSKGVLLSGGGVRIDYNNLNRNIVVNYFDGDEWHYSTDGQRDALIFASDPNNPDSIYMSTWGVGIYKIENGELSDHYTAANSALTDISGGSAYTRTCGIAYNNNSTLFIANAETEKGIVIKSPEGEWGQISYPMINKQHSTRKIIFTTNNNGWIIIPRNTYCGLFVFNTNNTDFDDSDDYFRGREAFDDERDCGNLQMWNTDGEVITNNVYDIVEDKNNILWFATDVGVVTFSGDKTIFTTSKPIFEQVKVPRNDGTNLADYLLEGIKTTAIAVDGGNRKWIGTSNYGVFLVNADGTEIVEHFTAENSPLPSNEITSIAIVPSSGEVFFATQNGLVAYHGNATEPATELSDIKVYPNPVRPEYTQEVRMTGFTDESVIKITDINGRLLHSTKSIGGMATWKCTNLDGNRATSGVYIVWATNADGTEKAVAKILVVK